MFVSVILQFIYKLNKLNAIPGILQPQHYIKQCIFKLGHYINLLDYY